MSAPCDKSSLQSVAARNMSTDELISLCFAELPPERSLEIETELRNRVGPVGVFRAAPSAKKATWVPTSERQPDVDGRLWAVLTDKVTNGRLVGFYPLYEYYHFDNGWATDERIMYWLDVEIPKLPSAPTDGKADKKPGCYCQGGTTQPYCEYCTPPSAK